MARRVPPADGAPAPAAGPAGSPNAVPAPALPGGAAGVIPTAATKIHFPGVPEGSAAPSPPPTGEVPKVSRYKVVNCPKPPNGTPGYRIVVNGSLSWLTDGKLVDSTTYDVDALRRQGVELEHVGDF